MLSCLSAKLLVVGHFQMCIRDRDIGEKKNLAAEHPEIVAKLKAILEKEKAK